MGTIFFFFCFQMYKEPNGEKDNTMPRRRGITLYSANYKFGVWVSLQFAFPFSADLILSREIKLMVF